MMGTLAWLPGGSLAPTISRAYASQADCLTAEHALLAEVEDAEFPTMSMSFNLEECHAVTNTSLANRI